MLAHVYFLKGEKNIKDILKKGRKKQSESFGVFYINQKSDNLPKFAFIVSKKISKLAINRNRVKRAMSESIRRNITAIPNGYVFVYLAKKNIVNKSTDEIMKEVSDFVLSFKEKIGSSGTVKSD